MKNVFLLLFSTLLFSQLFSQCDEYYINQLIKGTGEKCYFPQGCAIRFCPRLKGVSLNGNTFDTYAWDGISTQYITLSLNGGIAGTLVLKLNEKELLVNLNGCGGPRTYSISLNQQEYNLWLAKNNLIEKEKLDTLKVDEEPKAQDELEVKEIEKCVDFIVKESYGNDVFNAQWNGIQICEDQKEIIVGTETYYISRSIQNEKGDWIYYTQESRGYGWPEVGHVKVSKTMDIIEVKFLAEIAKFGVESPYIKAERERTEQKLANEEKVRRVTHDQKSYSQIDQALNDEKIELAIIKLNSLNYPKGYPRYNEFVKKQNEFLESEDLKIIDSIKLSIQKGEINTAIEEYAELSAPNLDIKNLIQTAINSKTYEEVKTLSTDLSGRIIKDYSSSFSDLPDGQYSLSLDKKGVVTILDSSKSNPKQICTNKNYLIIDGFEFPINYAGQLVISSEYSKKNFQDSVRFIFAERYKRKSLYKSAKNEYFIGKFGATLTAKIVDKPQFISSEVDKGEVLIQNLYLVQRKANGMLINDSKVWQTDKTIPLKSGIGRKIVKSITAPIWIWYFIL